MVKESEATPVQHAMPFLGPFWPRTALRAPLAVGRGQEVEFLHVMLKNQGNQSRWYLITA